MGAIYENLIRSLLFKMNPEQAHERGRRALMTLGRIPLACRLLQTCLQVKEDKPVQLFGLEFKNRVGLAAGMDKDGEFPRAVEALGFGHSEVGTVTPDGQPGNPTPRLFRHPESEALVNRMGFNNKGAAAMQARLARQYPKGKRGMPVGVNIGKAKVTPLEHAVEDYLSGFRVLADQADYFTINISSPNTEGLRDLQGARYLRTLLGALQEENEKLARKLGREKNPMLLKIAPDLSYPEIDAILEVLLDLGYDGIIATNTTIARPPNFSGETAGGWSGGAFMRARSNAVIKYIYRATSGRLPIVGVGGVDSPESAGEKMDAGASMVQLYTGWVYRGPSLARDIAKALKAHGEHWI
jgi:dihydroorotate dehydrogenase